MKKINKFLSRISEKNYEFTKKIYVKIYKNNNDFFIAEKFLINTFIFVYIYTILIGLMYNNSIKEIIIAMAITTSILVVFLLGVFIYCYNRKAKKVHKPTDSEWEELLKGNCYHLTARKNVTSIKKGHNILLNPTIYKLANLQVWFRNATYFFIEKPNYEDVKEQLLKEKSDVIISVPIKNLDRNRVRIRNNQPVLLYLDGYYGYGEINDFIL